MAARVCVLAFLLAFALHEVSAQVDSHDPDGEHMEAADAQADEEHGEHEDPGDEEPEEHEDMEYGDGPEEHESHEDGMKPEDEPMEHEDEPEEYEEKAEEQISVVDLYHMHGRVDADKNGQVSRSELMAYFHKAQREGKLADQALESFESVDVDHSGGVSLDELTATQYGDEKGLGSEEYTKALHEDKIKFTAADADEDGELNFEEYFSWQHPDERTIAAEAKSRLQEHDNNTDSMLSYHEFEELVSGGTHKLEGFGKLEGATQEAVAAFEFLDTDKNGFVSLEEFIPWELGHFGRDKAITELFAAADANGDKELNVEELMAIEKDMANHLFEHEAIHELVEFSRHEAAKEKAEKEDEEEHDNLHDKHKDEL